MKIDMILNSRVVVFNTKIRGYEYLAKSLQDEGHAVYLESADEEIKILELISLKKKPALLVLLTHNKQCSKHIGLLRKIKEQKPGTKIMVVLFGAYPGDLKIMKQEIRAAIGVDYILEEDECLSELMPKRMLGLLGESETERKELKEDIERFLAPHYFNGVITM